MMNRIILGFRFIFAHKWKIALTLWFTLFFIFVLFPLNDLNDFITMQVSKLTRKNVFLQFDQMRLNPFGPKISFNKVFVESGSLPTVSVAELTVAPSLAMIVSRQPEGTVTAQGLLKGDLTVQIKSGPKTDSGLPRSRIDLQAKNLNLKDVRELANLPVVIQGKLNLTSSALANLNFAEQPEADINLEILKFEMPSGAVSMGDLGRVNLPEIKLSQIELKGKLAAGKFIIENGKIGSPSDELFGDIKGDLALSFLLRDDLVTPLFGAYNIDLNLTATPGFKDRAKFFLTFLDGYKTDLPNGGARYKFKMRTTGSGIPPQFTPLR